MSIQFSDTTNKKGLAQLFEKEIGASYGDITGNTNLLKAFTADVNIAFDEFISLAFESGGTWQFDDSNHTDFPIITTNLVSSQRDYTFTTDEQGNLILDIYKVAIADSSGVFHDVSPVDVQSGEDLSSFYDGQNITGTPIKYDKTANGIFLDPVPSYNYTNGLKVYINREASYFTTSDTTKKPGVPGDLHKWFYIKPAYEYARRNTLAVKKDLEVEVERLKMTITSRFEARSKDERRRLTTYNHSNK